jgi:chorismate mutase/prephenate dehydratase
MNSFESICKSVESGENDFGVLAIQNSTSGSIASTYDLLKQYNLYITNTVDVPISHCLAVKEGTKLEDVKKVYSHPQGFAQCSQFMEKGHFEAYEYGNTSLSAKHVLESNEPIGAICSEHCAELYGLVPLIKGISDVLPNYTKFVCVSNKFKKSKEANIVSVVLEVPHVKGSLYRLLTKFFVCGLNLVKLESRPIMDGSFEVAFYLDFVGDVEDIVVSSLLTSMRNELDYFKFLGNYSHIS